MKATIFLSEEDLKNMVMERWAPRTSSYLAAGLEVGRKVRITELSLFGSTGGYVSFSDEPEKEVIEVPAPPPEVKPAKDPDVDIPDNIPF